MEYEHSWFGKAYPCVAHRLVACLWRLVLAGWMILFAIIISVIFWRAYSNLAGDRIAPRPPLRPRPQLEWQSACFGDEETESADEICGL